MLAVLIGASPIVALGLAALWAHRQSSADRVNDPGPEIWSQVGEWATSWLGMSDGGRRYFIDTGYPIPDGWRSFRGARDSSRIV